jgi:hypothetical protein
LGPIAPMMETRSIIPLTSDSASLLSASNNRSFVRFLSFSLGERASGDGTKVEVEETVEDVLIGGISGVMLYD